MFAHIIGDDIVEVSLQDPEGRFHPDVAWLPVPEDLQAWATPATLRLEAGEIVGHVAALRTLLKSMVTERRYGESSRGVIYNGHTFKSTLEDAANLATTAKMAELFEGIMGVGTFSVSYPTTAGFTTLNRVGIYSLGLAIGFHVQGCLNREVAIYAMLDAQTTWEGLLATFDAQVGTGWP